MEDSKDNGPAPAPTPTPSNNAPASTLAQPQKSTSKNSKNSTTLQQVKKDNKKKKYPKYFNYIPNTNMRPTKIINIYHGYQNHNQNRKKYYKPTSSTNAENQAQVLATNTETQNQASDTTDAKMAKNQNKGNQTPRNGPVKKTYKTSFFQTYSQKQALPEVGYNFSKFQNNIDILFDEIDHMCRMSSLDSNKFELARKNIKKMVGNDYFISEDMFRENLTNPCSFEYVIWAQYLKYKGYFDSKSELIKHHETRVFIGTFFALEMTM